MGTPAITAPTSRSRPAPMAEPRSRMVVETAAERAGRAVLRDRATPADPAVLMTEEVRPVTRLHRRPGAPAVRSSVIARPPLGVPWVWWLWLPSRDGVGVARRLTW